MAPVVRDSHIWLSVFMGEYNTVVTTVKDRPRNTTYIRFPIGLHLLYTGFQSTV